MKKGDFVMLIKDEGLETEQSLLMVIDKVEESTVGMSIASGAGRPTFKAIIPLSSGPIKLVRESGSSDVVLEKSNLEKM